MQPINKSETWYSLQNHYNKLKNLHLRNLFADDNKRFEKFSLSAAGLFLDYSKQRITSEVMELLEKLTLQVNLREHINRMFSGEIINTTEQRAVLHTALRNPDHNSIVVSGENIMPEIRSTLDRMLASAEKIHLGKWLGSGKKYITDVVNIGIGGSDLGPAMTVEALKPYKSSHINCHFVSNIDGTQIVETLKCINPETTLFIIASKTFTTQETLTNAITAKEWLQQRISNPQNIYNHLLAVTAAPQKALEFGIIHENIFPFWDWVGGRYSMWSSIGLPIAIAIGDDNFQKLLAGARAMDQHFQNAPFVKNMPVIMALLGIWNNNFLGAATQAVLPYDQYLYLLPAYLQQLEMESNGKHVNINGEPIEYSTCPVIWGSVGTNGQHAFHQLLMQGTQTIPADFILPLHTQNPIGEHHLLLAANCLAQSQALMQGRTKQEVIKELLAQGMPEKDAQRLAPHKVIIGNVPSSTILTDKIKPYTLGALIALYEHKVFTQGVIWGINSFDQWGVELGKQLTKNIVPGLRGLGLSDDKEFDTSTAGLINLYRHGSIEEK